MALKILLVEDEDLIGEMVRLNLEAEGHAVTWMKDGDAVAQLVAGEPFDIIVLDIMLPGIDGIEVARRVRAQGGQLPILMLTARGDIKTKVAGLDSGADDYLTKPFDMPELLARVRALTRRR